MASAAGSESHALFVAERGSEWIGCAGLFLADDGTPIVYSMWVAPAARGRGLGRDLLDTVRGWTAEHGHSRLRLDVMNTQEAARSLYAGYGFRPTGRTEALERDPSLVRVEMELVLTSS